MDARRFRSLVRGFGRVLLGLLVLWQLWFLLSANFLPMLDSARPTLAEHALVRQAAPDWCEKKGALSGTLDYLTDAGSRWAELTGAEQKWSLFAPDVTQYIPFVAVELRWDEDPLSVAGISPSLSALAATNTLESVAFQAVARSLQASPHLDRETLLSENEPADIHRFFRVGGFRLRKFEGYLDVTLPSDDGQSLDVRNMDWRDRILARVEQNATHIRAYLEWKLRRYQRQHPDRPMPRQVILAVRLYWVPAGAESPWDWHGPVICPVARWQPGVTMDSAYLPVEAFDPLVERFQGVRR